ncbi:MAG: nicotinamide-nucleotide amidohydrolase family protein [Bacilli bacterium]
MEELIKLLTEQNKTIATMESCTGGGIANAITNMPGASEVLKFSAVTYSNEYKIKMGVSAEIIDQYTVYSMETAMEMSKKISDFANADIGIGVTGKINREDIRNKSGDDSKIFVSIYDKQNVKYYNFSLFANSQLDREQNKLEIISFIVKKLTEILKK